VLDAPCGYGRVALPLAELGMRVCGVDYSESLLTIAKKADTKGSVTWQQADLRTAQLGSGYQAAINLFSSIGYGSEGEDRAILANLFGALTPGGTLVIDTMHRDALVTRRARGETAGLRGPNGLTMREKNAFDPVTGRIQTTWTWNSPTQSGQRSSEMRLYSVTELVVLLRDLGFYEIEVRAGLTDTPLTQESLGSRAMLLCRKPG